MNTLVIQWICHLEFENCIGIHLYFIPFVYILRDIRRLCRVIMEETKINRFVQMTEEEVNIDISNRIPKNTWNKMKWAMNIFVTWHNQWKIQVDNVLKVYEDIDEFIPSDLSYCLKYFFAEVRKVDGKMYPPESLKGIAAMIQLYFNTKLNWNVSVFLDKEFQNARDSLDAQMKKSAQQGNARPKKRALPIDLDQENELWEKGSFGMSDPEQLIHTLIYHLGIHLSLRAAKEHHDLEFGAESQLTLCTDSDGNEYLRYVERMSKNKRFGLKCTRMDPKDTRVYSNTENPNRYVVKLYKEYIRRRPDDACKAFYLTPLPKHQIKDNIWYKRSAMGIHKIESTTKRLMKTIRKDDEYYTNTSLRRTAKTRLVKGGITKEIASLKTGRISEKADSAYLQAEEFEKDMSRVLYGCEATTSNVITAPTSKSVNFHGCTFQNCSF